MRDDRRQFEQHAADAPPPTDGQQEMSSAAHQAGALLSGFDASFAAHCFALTSATFGAGASAQSGATPDWSRLQRSRPCSTFRRCCVSTPRTSREPIPRHRLT